MRIGARAMQKRAARAVDRARVFAVERKNIVRAAGRIVQIDMRQAFPSTPDADDFAIDFASSINNGFDD